MNKIFIFFVFLFISKIDGLNEFFGLLICFEFVCIFVLECSFVYDVKLYYL